MAQFAALNHTGLSRGVLKMQKIIKHPLIIFAKKLMLPQRKQKYLVVSQTDLERLQKLLSGEMA